MARNVIKREWDETPGAEAIVASFPDGVTERYSYANLTPTGKINVGLHGVNQKVFDSIAGDIKAGASWTEIRATLRKTYDGINEWESARGDSEGPGLTLLCEGVARAWGVDAAKVQTALKAMTPEQRKALGDAPDVKTAIAEVKLERAKANQAKAPAVDLTAIKAMFA